LQSIELHTGASAPFYALRFDADGRTMGPKTRQHLVDALGTFTDVYLFSHGWNNDWDTALKSYLKFAKTVREMIISRRLDFGRPYTPLLAGVFWPSSALVMPWEEGPGFAGAGAMEEVEDIERRLIAEVAQSVPVERLDDFYRLTEKTELAESEAIELLELVSNVFASGDPDLDNDEGRDVNDALIGWAKLEALLAGPELPKSFSDFGRGRPGAPASGPQTAAFLDKLNPRNLIRMLTVRQMKDRAGVVGANGVGPLLRDMLAVNENTRFHLVGHSYGARVLLNAVARPEGQPLPRPVDSLLLLQPAVNHLCFADTLSGGRAGGYRNAPDLVKRPIMTTFSVHDFPLRNIFHLALRRGKDIAEVEAAADEPPNQYAALGGYGPRGTDDWREVAIKDPDDHYDFGKNAPRIWAVNGAKTIRGHSDIYSESTAWALFDLATAG
jgi:pimeloyl-ACP methyl ester carboxylesterase